MGRLIDADAVKKKYPLMENDFGMTFNEGIHKAIDSMPTVDAIPKAQYDELKANITMMQLDYEARLKADVLAILTELQLEIEEKAIELCDDGWYLTYNDLIQQKINALKGEV